MGLSELPEDVLTILIDEIVCEKCQVWWYCWDCCTHLKQLRLSCKRFPYHPRLLRHLFRDIRLYISPEQCHDIRNLDLSRIIPYVEQVTFFPSPYAENFDIEIFNDILIYQEIVEYCKKHRLHPLYHLAESQPWDKFVQDRFDGKYPFTSKDVSDGFTFYQEQARKANALYESSELLTTWACLLKLLNRCKSFRITDWDGHPRPSQPPHVKCTVQDHVHDFIHEDLHKEEDCYGLISAHGNAPFGVAVSAMMKAGSLVEQLTVACKNRTLVRWDEILDWSKWDLSSLRTLRFTLQCPFAFQPRDVEYNIGALVMEILEKCATNIVDLKVEGSLYFPLEHQPLSLPKLQQLHVSQSKTPFAMLAVFLTKATALSQLKLESLKGCEPGEWRNIIDAVRNHPNRMCVDFTELPVNDATELSLSHHTAKESALEKNSDPWSDIDRSVQNYISGNGGWNRSLKMWFDYAGSDTEDDTEGDNDDDDDGSEDETEDDSEENDDNDSEHESGDEDEDASE